MKRFSPGDILIAIRDCKSYNHNYDIKAGNAFICNYQTTDIYNRSISLIYAKPLQPSGLFHPVELNEDIMIQVVNLMRPSLDEPSVYSRLSWIFVDLCAKTGIQFKDYKDIRMPDANLSSKNFQSLTKKI